MRTVSVCTAPSSISVSQSQILMTEPVESKVVEGHHAMSPLAEKRLEWKPPLPPIFRDMQHVKVRQIPEAKHGVRMLSLGPLITDFGLKLESEQTHALHHT